MQNFKDIGVLPVDDMSEPFWQDAGNLKVTIKRISLADCFELITARNFKSPFVTSDHHELEAVSQHFPEIEIMFSGNWLKPEELTPHEGHPQHPLYLPKDLTPTLYANHTSTIDFPIAANYEEYGPERFRESRCPLICA